MKLSEIFFHLSTGELSQLSIGGGASGEINENNHERVLGFVNLALTALYTRFVLKEREVLIPLQSDATLYHLDIDDLLKIEKISSDSGNEIPLNKGGDPFSCRTPSLQTLYVPQNILNKDTSVPPEYITNSILVSYRANHPKISAAQLDIGPEMIDVELPFSHLQALLYNVASRIHNPIGMVNEFHSGNSYAAKYERACQELELEGLQLDPEHVNDRLQQNGWI